MALTSTKNQNRSNNSNINKGFCKHKSALEKILSLLVDDEAKQEDKIFFDNHIKNCVICAHEYHLELSLKKALKTKIEKKIVPDELINTIKKKVKANE